MRRLPSARRRWMRYGDDVLGTMYDTVFGRKDPLCQELKTGKEKQDERG